jgi:catechol 2,3-dioxygenase-like lactoylglutathione lyase family enzyme
MPSLDGVDHVHVFVSDRAAAEAWYGRVLGLSRVSALERWATGGGPLTLADASDRIHLALFERPALPCRSTIAMGTTAAEFIAWRGHLERALDAPVRLEDHDVAWSIYFADPDGNPYEITTYDHEGVVRMLAAGAS